MRRSTGKSLRRLIACLMLGATLGACETPAVVVRDICPEFPMPSDEALEEMDTLPRHGREEYWAWQGRVFQFAQKTERCHARLSARQESG